MFIFFRKKSIFTIFFQNHFNENNSIILLNSKLYCDGCKIHKDNHEKNIDFQKIINEWNSEECTKLKPTDAYGEIIFPGFHFKTAKV